ncbi:MAG: CBS domain-containing protein [Desulfobacterota bacterium]|nr:CBS domain-containing protein [Thermodesulfobacteriota bacterium]
MLARVGEKGGDSPINDLLIPPVFVFEDQLLSEVFKEIKKNHAWMVFVKNEYGGISGLITIEDLIEEIVGEISDEDQTENQEIVPQEDNSFLVSGSVSLYKLSEALGITFEDEDCQTIGGLITKLLGNLPKRNERIELDGISVVVLSADSRKVNRVLIRRK